MKSKLTFHFVAPLRRWRQVLPSSRGNELVRFNIFRYTVAPNCEAFCLQLFQVIMKHPRTHARIHTHLISWSLYSITTRREICHNTAQLCHILPFRTLPILICQNSNIPHCPRVLPKAQAAVATPLMCVRAPSTPFDMYRVIHKSLRDFRTRLRNNQNRHGRKEHINR